MSSPASASPSSSTSTHATRPPAGLREYVARHGPRLELALVFAAWAVMSVLAWLFVATYASPIPFQDDTELIAGLLPGAKLDWHFWWVPANEHRIVIPRAIYMALLGLTHDFRGAMFFQVVAQSLLALALILFARRLRGSTRAIDAFFPLLLLHWGNAANFLLGMQITIAVPTVLTCAFLMLALARRGPPSPTVALWMGVCVFLLPLNGGFGLTQMPPLLAWMAVAGFVLARRTEPSERKSGLVLLGGTATCVLLVVYYFVDFQFPESNSRSFDLARVLRTTLQFLSLNLGPVAVRFKIPAQLFVCSFAAIAAVFALRDARRDRAELWRASAVVATLAAACSIAVSVGISRTDMGYTAGLATRYVILPAPLFVAAYLALCRFGPRLWATAIQAVGCLVLVLALPTDFTHGEVMGLQHLGSSNELRESVRSGAPIEAVVAQNWRAFYPTPEGFRARLLQLCAIGYPPFEDPKIARSWPKSDPYFMFEPRPRSVRDAGSATVRRILQENALLVRAESEIVLAPPLGARKLTGAFGMLPNAWNGSLENGRRSDGVAHVIEWRDANGETRELSRRELRAHEREGDRGVQKLELVLPSGPGELVLRTQNLSGANQAYDLSFWSRIEVR